jgi:hypothetical protein
VFNSDWNDFVRGELAHSNDLNNRALGGRQRSNSDDEDEMSGRHDEDMEKIMNRFNIVNNLISKSNDDDDDKDDKDGNDANDGSDTTEQTLKEILDAQDGQEDEDKHEDEPENEDKVVQEII